MDKFKVMIVDDEVDFLETIVKRLKARSIDVSGVESGYKALEVLDGSSPDVIILDLGLPDMDGLEVLRQIRSFSDVPVIILTARGEEMDKVKGLELGADDYITKPFAPAEFLARIKTVLRRSQRTEPKAGEKPLVRGKLRIDFATREVSIGDRLIKLTPSEYNLLCELSRNEGRVLSNHMLLERVWGPEYTTETEYIKVYIQRLREKLEEEPGNPKMILSERGIGYKFVSRG